jgi:mannosyltransferase OCH1-like enzyme
MIEKNIFQSWYTKDLDPRLKKKIINFRRMNPLYKYYLYDDKEIDEFVNKYYEGEIADSYNKLNIIVAKVDFWRYLILYKYGGIYVDMDSSINKNLDKLIKENDQAIISVESHFNSYVQWGLIFSKEHPILKKTIDLIVENIKNNSYPNDIHRMTGPTLYTKAINYVNKNIFNKIIDIKKIKRGTDITFGNNNISYRLYGIDYNDNLSYKHNLSNLLYVNKKHWRDEEKEKNLLI